VLPVRIVPGMNISILAAGLLLLTTSCYTIVHDYGGRRAVTPGEQLPEASESLGSVSGSKRACFLFWGLFPTNDVSGAGIVESAAAANRGDDFDAISRVRIREEQDALDVIVEFVTLGIFTMITVEAEGEVHRYVGGDA
jgi:hypothetical protein